MWGEKCDGRNSIRLYSEGKYAFIRRFYDEEEKEAIYRRVGRRGRVAGRSTAPADRLPLREVMCVGQRPCQGVTRKSRKVRKVSIEHVLAKQVRMASLLAGTTSLKVELASLVAHSRGSSSRRSCRNSLFEGDLWFRPTNRSFTAYTFRSMSLVCQKHT